MASAMCLLEVFAPGTLALMPAYYLRALPTFLSDSASSIIGELAERNAAARFKLTPEAIDAWRDQLPPLQDGVGQLLNQIPRSRDWTILLEYPIPIVGKRIDAVILADGFIIVLETKTGKSPTSAARQVDDYALSLACFHEPSHQRTIIPVVVSDAPTALNSSATHFDELVERCEITSTTNLGALLCRLAEKSSTAEPLNATEWNNGRFRPIPPIIDAAVALYSNKNIFEIDHAAAAREDLECTTRAIISAVTGSKLRNQKTLCFVTGVPGAGKTLVGLNAVHQPEIRNEGSFLSGNGPLVKIIREALIRDHVRRDKVTRRQAELEAEAFVYNVHRFADSYYREGAPRPAQKVVVFDEAQRAWDAEQNARAKRPKVAESHMLLEVMDRHDDWAVIVALVGGGQEINKGEAGLSEWGRTLSKFPNWNVLASPEVLKATAPSRFRLFSPGASVPPLLTPSENLHLETATRSIRAQRISDWVDALLHGSSAEARAIALQLESAPKLTRGISETRHWLDSRRRGSSRAGLVASAGGARLRADGLETNFDFHQRFDWERWFLDTPDCYLPDCDHKYCSDVRSSSKLEVAATQFEIQGLELDWIGLCWGEDLIWSGTEWKTFNFSGKKWRENTNVLRHEYRLNGYRVLLTRARQGMVIYVPKPPLTDPSRMHINLDRTADFLIECGAQHVADAAAKFAFV
jgi:hypothetical protein